MIRLAKPKYSRTRSLETLALRDDRTWVGDAHNLAFFGGMEASVKEAVNPRWRLPDWRKEKDR